MIVNILIISNIITPLILYLYVQKKGKVLQDKVTELTIVSNLSRDKNIKYEEEIFKINDEKTRLVSENSKLLESIKHLKEKELLFAKQFEDMARKILQDNSDRLNKASSSTLEGVLQPFKEKLTDFRNKVEQVYNDETKHRESLRTHIDILSKHSDKVAEQADNLSKALKGDNKLQGDWGEIQLEKILETSGLIKDVDYTLQGSGLNLKDEDSGRHQKPDVIINLPDKKHVIVDAKVNLVAYERYFNAENKEDKSVYLKQFLNALKEQIKNLSSKDYYSNAKLSSPEYVIMFVPIDGAYRIATLGDQDIFRFAIEKKIILTNPSNLYALLKTIAYVISNEKKMKNSEEILRQSADMYDKFINFVDVLNKVGDSIDKSKEQYDDAMKKLRDGKGNLINRAKNLEKLGLSSKKNIADSVKISSEDTEYLDD